MEICNALEEIIAEYALGFSIFLGTVFGLMAALAKALHGGVVPTARWWFVRLLLVGFFALTAGWAAEIFHLSNTGVAFVTSFLNLMGFAAVEMIERRGQRVIEGEPRS